MSVSSKFKVLHCAETIKGGIATYLNELLPLQVEAYGNGAVLLVIPESQRVEVEGISGVQVFTYVDHSSRVLNAFRLCHVVLKTAFTHRVCLLHVHSTFAGASIRAVNLILFKYFKSIYCPHGWAWDIPTGKLINKIIKKVEYSLSWVTDMIVCISEHEKNSALDVGIKLSKLALVKNGISLEPPVASPMSLNLPTNKRLVLFVGRFDKQKGADIFYEAINSLSGSVHGVMAGGNVVDKSIAFSPTSNITHAGWVNKSQLQYLFECSDVIVIPSRWEGFGLIALEAMRAGLPVIATKVGGLKEVVMDGTTGVLISPNSAEELRDAICKLSTEQLIAMGSAGKSRVEAEFGMRRVHEELDALYRKVLFY